MPRRSHIRSISIMLLAVICAALIGALAPAASFAGDQPRHPEFIPIATTQPGQGNVVHDQELGRGPADMPNPPSYQQDAASARSLQSLSSATRITTATIDLKLLVIAADGNEPVLPAIRQALDYQGTPYTVWIAAQHPNGLTAAVLSSGNHGLYQGVILTTGSLSYSPDNGVTWLSALSQPEWQALWDYETAFGIRQATWYTFPTTDYGFGPAAAVDTAVTPVAAALTPAGQSVFSYLNPTTPISISNAYTYLAPTNGISSTALLVDGSGNALAAVKSYPDGRENLALTFDSNPYLLHDLILAYGVVNWVTRGLFLGQRHIFLGAQVDDLFLPDEIWTPSTPCGTDPEATGAEYRITGGDLSAVVAWQGQIQARPTSQAIRLDMAFNGGGTSEAPQPDTLLSAATAAQGQFKWINHTYNHALLTSVDYATASAEIGDNNSFATTLGLNDYSPANLVTPEISGLFNAQAMQAAYDRGVRYVVSDTSHPEQGTPTPNGGTYNQLQPGILMIPRRPNNLFYNVSQPAEWAAEYNCLYHAFWGRDLTYDEILEKESDMLLRYLLLGEIYPWMFHQPNLRAYDGTHTLLGDLVDRTLAKYDQLLALPIQSPTMDDLGRRVADRMRYDQAGVTASIVPGQSITLHAQQATSIPVTGLCVNGSENYGGQQIADLALQAGQSVSLSLSGCPSVYLPLVQ